MDKLRTDTAGSYEMVDLDQMPETSEAQNLERGDEDTSQLSIRSSSEESDTSVLFSQLTDYAEQNADIEDFTTHPSFVQRSATSLKQTPSKYRKLVYMLLVAFTISVWLWTLFRSGYTNKPKNDKGVSNSTATATATDISSSSIAATSTTTPVPTRSIIPVKEYNIHKSRDPLPTKSSDTKIITTSIDFIQGIQHEKKTDDEGLHLEYTNDNFIVRKLSDEVFENVIQKTGKFTVDGQVYDITELIPNAEVTFGLIKTNVEKLFRHSNLAQIWLYDIREEKFVKIVDDLVQHASWSPSFRYITYIQNNDLFIYNIEKKESKRITKDGSQDIFNGRPDWVYEEEVLSSNSAFWWSPKEDKLIYLKTDDTKVKSLNLEFFVNDDGYPSTNKIKYPKPGGDNPIVSLQVYDLKSGETSTIDHSDSQLGDDFIVYGALWVDDSNFVIKETNRQSKILNFRLFNAADNLSRVAVTQNAVEEYNGWIDNFSKLLAIPRNEAKERRTAGFVDVLAHQEYNHIAYYKTEENEPVWLTSGDWEVLDIVQFDQEGGELFFLANRQSPFEKHLYSVNIDTKIITSITDTEKLGYYDVKVSPTTRFVIQELEGPGFPLLKLQDTLTKRAQLDFTGERKSYHTIEIGTDEQGNPITVNLVEQRPAGFNENGSYPLLVSVYSGPGSQKADVKFHVSFEDQVSEKTSAVTLYIDPRGTGGQGWRYRSAARNHIGYNEPRDITAATEAWIKSHAYIDPDRTAIWGWSYGGFTTLKTLEYDAGNVFKYGMSVAPVTNWMLYDSIFTERIMGLPSENKEGYNEARVYKFDGLKAVNRFLLMHGTGDDNVHIQNTYRLLDDFNLHNVVNFDMALFPDSNHNINYHNAWGIIMERLGSWIQNAFAGNFDDFILT